MNTLITICKGMRVGCDIIDVSTQAVRFVGEPAPDETPASGSQLIVRIVLAILGITEVGASACNASMTTMEGIKGIELFIHGCNVPVRIINAGLDCCDGDITMFQALEQGLTPILSAARSFRELQIYHETNYLEMSPEQRAREHRSVVKPGSDPKHPEYIDVPVTEADCKERLAEAQAIYLPVLVGEIAVRTGIISTTGNRLTDIYHNLISRLRPQRGAPAVGGAIPPARVVAAPPPVAPVGAPAVGVIPDYDPFDLLAQQVIPQELHEDPVLAKYTCAITMSPIRHPVGDPNGVTLYERSAIIQWIQQNGTSPPTRLPLRVDQLLPKPATAAIINSRLQFHSNRLRTLAETSVAHIAPDVVLQGAADLENPRLN